VGAQLRNPLNKKLFRELTDSSPIGLDQVAGSDFESKDLMSLNEIIIQYQAKRSTIIKDYTQTFAVETSCNKYTSESDGGKIVKIKILDVLFDNQVCSLVQLRDVTKQFNTGR